MPMAIKTITSGEIEPKVLRDPGPLALDFYGESCPPCRALEPRLERIAGRYEGRLPVYRVDAERDLPVAESFGVTTLPTVLVFRDGKEVERLDGLIREDDLADAFDRAARA
jgi:thioredoxin 1